jgi:hypothetical protein
VWVCWFRLIVEGWGIGVVRGGGGCGWGTSAMRGEVEVVGSESNKDERERAISGERRGFCGERERERERRVV